MGKHSGRTLGRVVAGRVAEKASTIIRVDSPEDKALREFDAANGREVQNYVDTIEGRKPAAVADVPDMTPEQRQRLPYVMAASRPCLLHLATTGEERAPYVVGTWQMPDDLAKGRADRTVFYSLCKNCASMVGIRELIAIELRKRLEAKQPKAPLIAIEGGK